MESSHSPNSRRSTATKVRRGLLVLLACGYVVLWVGGIGQYWLKGGGAAGPSWAAALFLTLAGLLVLGGAHTGGARLWLLAVALLGFGAEVLGVHARVPFGAYNYTTALGPQLFGVPPVMAFAWMTLAAYVKQMVLRFNFAAWLELLVAATWLTAFDLLIDPLAANQLGYWRWAAEGPYYGVPLTNFAGWFGVSLLAFGLLRGSRTPNPTARLTGLSLSLFFTLLALAFASYAVAAIGGGLILLHLLLCGRGRCAAAN